MCFTSQFWDLTVAGLAIGAVYALIALGYTLVYGVLQLINFAHSEVFMLGAFGSVFALRPLVGDVRPVRGHLGRRSSSSACSSAARVGAAAARSCSSAPPTARCGGATPRSSPT